jgi:hypothetical protein
MGGLMNDIRGMGVKLDVIVLLGSIEPVRLIPFMVASRLFRGEDMAVEWDMKTMDQEAFRAFCSV